MPDGIVLDEHELARLLELEIERAKRGEASLTILVGRADRLPASSNGVAALEDADPMPELLGRILLEQKRQIDSICSLDRGRLALILPQTNEHGAMMIGERVLATLTQRSEESVWAGFGIAAFPRHGRTPDALVRTAGRGLLAARTLSSQGSPALEGAGSLVMTTPAPSRSAEEPSEPLQALLALAETVDVRDRKTAGHAQLVGRYAELIARELGLPDSVVGRIRLAGVLHDVGKFGVPRSVLQKPGPLDENERAAVRRHAELGAELLEGSQLEDVSEWIRDHHEQPDGLGYPRGLRAGEISLEARVLAVADAYEAMTTERSHRSALSHTVARQELVRCAGTQFDRRVVQAFLRQLERQCPVRVGAGG